MFKRTLEDGTPLLRFAITETQTGKTVAVVEATDAVSAQERFERVRGTVEFLEQMSCAVYSVQEQSVEAEIRCSSFLQGYFEVLDGVEHRLQRLRSH